MPTPGSLKAPSFSGDTADLKEFFEDFEELVKGCELSEEEKVRGVVKYAEKEVRKFWKTLKGYEEKKWIELKQQIMDAYPGSGKGHRYTVAYLSKLVSWQSKQRITSESHLLTYYHKFRPVAQALKTDGKISETE
ncbi:hypothetical protein K435DRAFT_618291, partial [Dendrothele bispora CBS 962.96]